MRYVFLVLDIACSSVVVKRRQTRVRTAEQTGSHAHVSMPLDRMKTNKPSDKRTRQILIPLLVGVVVCRKLLQHADYRPVHH